jgi:hypothetical protein
MFGVTYAWFVAPGHPYVPGSAFLLAASLHGLGAPDRRRVMARAPQVRRSVRMTAGTAAPQAAGQLRLHLRAGADELVSFGIMIPILPNLIKQFAAATRRGRRVERRCSPPPGG